MRLYSWQEVQAARPQRVSLLSKNAVGLEIAYLQPQKNVLQHQTASSQKEKFEKKKRATKVAARTAFS